VAAATGEETDKKKHKTYQWPCIRWQSLPPHPTQADGNIGRGPFVNRSARSPVHARTNSDSQTPVEALRAAMLAERRGY
jgi:hypothetical protein